MRPRLARDTKNWRQELALSEAAKAANQNSETASWQP
jgi:hypothetical protein